jgi:hypothetical protein
MGLGKHLRIVAKPLKRLEFFSYFTARSLPVEIVDHAIGFPSYKRIRDTMRTLSKLARPSQHVSCR